MSKEAYKDFFKGKRITLMGLGLLGRGLGDAEFLAKCGAQLTVTDLKSEIELKSSVSKLKKYKNIKYVLGNHRMEDFQNVDLIIKSAGVPLNSPYIENARAKGVPIEMSTALFARFSPATIVGITGTRGKSTTTHLLYEILKASGRKVFLGGNVRGLSTLALLPKVKQGDVVVLELDSWQLQGFGEAKISPHIAIFTNFLNDHLNYYKGNTKAYFEDKANIFLNQKKEDYLIVGKKVASMVRERLAGESANPKILIPKPLPTTWKLSMLGIHNRENASLSVEAARVLGVSENIIKKVTSEFKGVPGRLEFVREVRGVKVYNDTTATTPDATLVALSAFAPQKPILIMGGADKELDMTKLLKALPKMTKKVVLLPGSGTDKLVLAKSLGKSIIRATNLSGAVREALDVAKKGDILLFSPAFASFGMFKNEFDRGEKFIKLIRSLK